MAFGFVTVVLIRYNVCSLYMAVFDFDFYFSCACAYMHAHVYVECHVACCLFCHDNGIDGFCCYCNGSRFSLVLGRRACVVFILMMAGQMKNIHKLNNIYT